MMASKYWIKLYHEILEDPKMGRLPDNIWRRAIELFLMAGELDNGGQLPCTEDIAWRLRLSRNETLLSELRTLNECEILTHLEDGTWLVTNFARRQKADTDARRIAEFRKRQRKNKAEQPPHSGNHPDISVNNTDEMGDYPENPVNDTGHQAVNDTTVANGEECNLSLHESYTDIDKDIDIDSDKDKESTTVGASQKKSKSIGPKSKLKNRFLELTNLPWPNRKPDQKFWWSNFQEILSIADNDLEQAQKIMATAIKHARRDELTITGPKSIVGLCRAAKADEVPDPNPAPSSGWQTDYDETESAQPLDPTEALRTELWAQLAAQTTATIFNELWDHTDLATKNGHYELVPPSPEVGAKLQRWGIKAISPLLARQLGRSVEIEVRM